MKKLKTYFIQRSGKSIWLSQNETPLTTDVVLEERKLTIADDGKVLATKDGQIIGTCLWNKDNQELIEIDMPEDEEVKDG